MSLLKQKKKAIITKEGERFAPPQRQRDPSLSIPHGTNDIMGAFFPPTEEHSDVAEVIDKLNIKDKDMDLLGKLSDLHDGQILAISILRTAAKQYKITDLDNILNEFMSLLISKKRWGRKEIIDTFGKGQQQLNPFGMGMGGGTAPGDQSKLMGRYKG